MSAKNEREALSPPWDSMTPSILVCSVKLQLLLRLESFWLFLFLRQKMDSLSWVSEITVGDFMYSSTKKIHLLDTVVTGSAKTLNNILFSVWEWQLSLHSACSVLLLEADINTIRACSVVLLVTLCDPIVCSLPGSSVYGNFQARILEWVVISYSRGSSQLRDWTCLLCLPHRQADSLPLSHLGSLLTFIEQWDPGSIPGLGRIPGGEHGNPLPYSCLENPHEQRSLAGSQRVRHSWVTKHIIC